MDVGRKLREASFKVCLLLILVMIALDLLIAREKYLRLRLRESLTSRRLLQIVLEGIVNLILASAATKKKNNEFNHLIS
jgi:hypothetical protein